MDINEEKRDKMRIVIEVVVPIVTAILGFLGGCTYTKGKTNTSKIGKGASNNTVIQDSDIKHKGKK